MSGNHNSGRRPRPTSIRVLEGNRGRRPLNENEPKPSPIAPDAPSSLTNEERAEWDYICFQLDAMGTLAVSDRYVIQQLAQAVVDYAELRAFIRANGRTFMHEQHYIDANGTPAMKAYPKPWPEVKLMKEARQDVYRFSTLLGLDPASRSRLHVSAPKVVDANLADLLSPDGPEAS